MKLIQIIERNCTDKVQSNIVVGKQYYATNADPLKDGTECLLVRENKDSKPHRINAKRFKWKVIDLSQMQRQVQECNVTLQQEELSNKFSVNELAHQVIMPIVIYNLAIVYTERLLKELADNRIEQTRKLSRVMKDLIQQWRNMLDKNKANDPTNIVDHVADTLLREHSRPFAIFYYSVNSAIKKYSPFFAYPSISTYAIIALSIINYANKFLNGVSSEVKGAINGKQEYISSPIIDKLKTCIEASAGNIDIDSILKDENVSRNVEILHNSLKGIRFDELLKD